MSLYFLSLLFLLSYLFFSFYYASFTGYYYTGGYVVMICISYAKICCINIGYRYSRVGTHCFWLFLFWFIDEDASCFRFFSQDNEHTELMVLLFFQNPYAIFARTFCNITMIFKVMLQYFPALFKRIHNPYSFGGKIKQITCQIRHKLSVAIHEKSTS